MKAKFLDWNTIKAELDKQWSVEGRKIPAGSEKFKLVWARCIANTGDVAVMHTTCNNLVRIDRGWSPRFLDMFRDEFLSALPVGWRTRMETDGRQFRFLHVRYSHPKNMAKFTDELAHRALVQASTK